MRESQIIKQIKRINNQLGDSRFKLVKYKGSYVLEDTKGEITARTLECIKRELTHFEKGLVHVSYSYSLNEASEDTIKNVTGKRYDYFHFSNKIVEEIAETPIEKFTWGQAAVIMQALFPNNLICSGLFDSFLIFEVENGNRIDPPKFYYRSLSSRVNNCDNKQQLRLIEVMLKLFETNNIKCHESWISYCEKYNKENE